MDAYIPAATADDVLRIVRRDFPDERSGSVVRLLRGYGTETWHREVHRVHLAILKLAGGDPERLLEHLQVAAIDFRDVLFAAECPRASRLGFTGAAGLTASELDEMRKEDWEEYQDWLRRPGEVSLR